MIQHRVVLAVATNAILVNDRGHRVGAMILPMVFLRLYVPPPLISAGRTVARTARRAWALALGPGWAEDLRLMGRALVWGLGPPIEGIA